MHQFWKRRHPATRMVLATLLLPVIYGTALLGGAYREAKELTEFLPSLYRELKNTPREAR